MLKKNNISGIGIGTTSVIMIFVVLCLSILATLLYTVTNSDGVITDKKISYALRYQMADNVAVETLAEVDEKLYMLCKKNIPFYNNRNCRVVLDSLKNVSIDYKTKKISYMVGLEDNINLEVVLQVNTSNTNSINKNNRYSIVKWNIVTDIRNMDNNKVKVWK